MRLPEALERAADAQGNIWDAAAGEWVPSASSVKDLEERAAAAIEGVLLVVQDPSSSAHQG